MKNAKAKLLEQYGYAPAAWTCPKCKKPTRIIDTRQIGTAKRMRTRTCPNRHRFITYETFDHWAGEGRAET